MWWILKGGLCTPLNPPFFRRKYRSERKIDMTGKGFLGTSASVLSDISLLMGILVALTLTVGMLLAVSKRYSAHRWVQTTAVSINVVQVLTIMVASFFKSAAPGIPQKLNETYY